MCSLDVARESPCHVARASGRHVGAPTPASAGTQMTPPVDATDPEPVEVRRRVDETDALEPRHRCAHGIDLAVHARCPVAVGHGPGEGRRQAGGGRGMPGADIGEEKRSCAVGAFGIALGQAAFCEKSRLLVDDRADDGDAGAEGTRGPQSRIARDDLGHRQVLESEGRDGLR